MYWTMSHSSLRCPLCLCNGMLVDETSQCLVSSTCRTVWFVLVFGFACQLLVADMYLSLMVMGRLIWSCVSLKLRETPWRLLRPLCLLACLRYWPSSYHCQHSHRCPDLLRPSHLQWDFPPNSTCSCHTRSRSLSALGQGEKSFGRLRCSSQGYLSRPRPRQGHTHWTNTEKQPCRRSRDLQRRSVICCALRHRAQSTTEQYNSLLVYSLHSCLTLRRTLVVNLIYWFAQSVPTFSGSTTQPSPILSPIDLLPKALALLELFNPPYYFYDHTLCSSI